MIIETSIKVRNYKCFGEKEQGFEKILPINIIIGKNNSGKSSLIDLIEYATDPSKDLIGTNTNNAKCIFGLSITENLLEEVGLHYATTVGSDAQAWKNHVLQHGRNPNHIVEKKINFTLNVNNGIGLIENKNSYGQYEGSFFAVFKSFFAKKNSKE